MDLRKIAGLMKRVGLALAVAGTAVYATSGCSVTDTLQQLVNQILPGTAA